MEKRPIAGFFVFSFLLGICFLMWAPTVPAQQQIKYSCSTQIYAAFEKERIPAFKAATGFDVIAKPSSSMSSAYLLEVGKSDIASSARKLYDGHEIYGYTETPFCKDPLAVIARKECGVEGLSEAQLQDIFAGEIKNWREVGGADLPIMVIVPDKGTAAHKNFRRQVMKHKDIAHDFMAYNSTMVIEAVKYFPCGAVSFISRGAAIHHEGVKALKVNGLSPTDKEYPYFQIFYYVTKGDPTGAVKKFIDHAFSEEGAGIMRENGMIPLTRQSVRP